MVLIRIAAAVMPEKIRFMFYTSYELFGMQFCSYPAFKLCTVIRPVKALTLV